MRDNFGTHRHKLMYNDYIIIGPKNNKIKLENSESILEVFSKIYNNKLTFISRSDSSGTHAAEMAVWEKINLNPRIHSGSWYLESGQGMGRLRHQWLRPQGTRWGQQARLRRLDGGPWG